MHVQDALTVSDDRLESALRDMFDPKSLYLGDRHIWAEVEQLLKKGRWKLSSGNPASSQALLYTTMLGFCKISEWLLSEKGANVNVDSSVALRTAARYGQEDMVDLLIRRGARANGHKQRQNTALHLAAERGDSNIARLLIKSGAKVDSWGKASKTPLHNASEYGHKDVVRILIDGAEANTLEYLQQKDVNSGTALHYAAERGHTDIVRLLINEAGVNALDYVQQKDVNGHTALHVVARNLNAECAQVLVQSGALVNDQDNAGKTALHLAISSQPLLLRLRSEKLDRDPKTVIRALIKNGASANIKDMDGSVGTQTLGAYL
jgi:ankyrin repeat protein